MPLHDQTTEGDIAHFLAGEDLTGKEARLVKLTHDGGVPEVVLPTADDDITPYVTIYGDEDGEPVTVRPLEHGKQTRVTLKGTCNPGDRLCLAATATAGDKGKVRALPAAAGTYRCFAIAEEAGTDGQAVLLRRDDAASVVVSE